VMGSRELYYRREFDMCDCRSMVYTAVFHAPQHRYQIDPLVSVIVMSRRRRSDAGVVIGGDDIAVRFRRDRLR